MRVKDELWAYLKERDEKLWRRVKYASLAMCGNWPKNLTLAGYRIVRKIYKFN